jgi:hypothetical protein
MKLVSVALHGYKRFAERSSMNVDGKLVAIVGPNESGKTSFLDALRHLTHFESFRTSGPERELTRGREIPDNQDVIEATYLVEDGDREALKDVPGIDQIRWCLVAKQAGGGSHYYTFKPLHLRRSLRPRQRAVRLLNGVSSRQRFERVAEQSPYANFVDEVRGLASILETSEETLSDETRAKIGSVTTMLESAVHDEGPQYVRELSQLLQDLAEHEADRPPWRKVIDVISKRKPTFSRFSDDERLLASEYNIEEVWQNPPAALRNLTRLADLDLEVLHNAVTANDFPTVAGLEERTSSLHDDSMSSGLSRG